MNYYERNAIERINEITDNSELRRHLLSVEILIKELVVMTLIFSIVLGHRTMRSSKELNHSLSFVY